MFPEDRVRGLLESKSIPYDSVIRIVEVGSTAHGISNPETGDDFDYTVVRLESIAELVIGEPSAQSMMIRTQPEGQRSRAGDIDLNVFTLRRFARLAANSNPSILAAIFSPFVHKGGPVDFEELGWIVASRRAGEAFLGYMRHNIERWVGTRGQKDTNRPELVEAYGFDTKYAAHTIRLGIQGIEYMREGRFSMPLRKDLANEIISLRTGGMSEDEALRWARGLEEDLRSAIKRSPLPPSKGGISVDNFLLQAYQSSLSS